MSLLSTIEYQNGFSDLEKKIADYLIEHIELKRGFYGIKKSRIKCGINSI